MMREINLLTGTTFVLVTHDPDVADACDRVIHMRDGVVTSDEMLIDTREPLVDTREPLVCCAG